MAIELLSPLKTAGETDISFTLFHIICDILYGTCIEMQGSMDQPFIMIDSEKDI